ncbi:MAG: APC family permease [Actinobacteria bacterium]|nr:APC family permease [Actinomycetota bacterium]
MGVFDIVFTVLAFNAPMSVFVGFITVIIGYGNGLGTPVTYLGAGLLMMIFGVGFTAMSRYLPNPGAFYAYITAGLGRPIGLGAAFVALVSYIFILIGGYAFGGLSFQVLVRDTLGGPDLPWYAYTAVVMLIVGTLGFFRIALSARILTIFMCGEVIMMLAYDLAVIFRGGGADGFNVESFKTESITSGSVGLAILFGVVCFSGFEATAIFREEARDPEKTIPRATYTAILVLAGLYFLTSWLMILGVGISKVVEDSAADPTGTALATAAAYLGKIGADIITVLLVTSIFAANLAAHNVTTRYVYSLSVDRIFPKVLSVVHHTEVSPHRASITTTVVSLLALTACIIFGGDATTLYAVLVGIGGYSLIMLLLLTSMGIIGYFRRHPELPVHFSKTVVAPVAAIAGLAVAFVLATQNVATMIGGNQQLANLLVILFFALLVLGVVVALVLKRTHPEVYRTIGRQDI